MVLNYIEKLLVNNPSTITAIATIALVFGTITYATLTYKMIIKYRKEDDINFIERKLEKLYYPLKFTIEEINFLENNEETDKEDKLYDFANYYNQIIPYLYLSSENSGLKKNLVNFTILLRRTSYFKSYKSTDGIKKFDEHKFEQHKQEFLNLRDNIHAQLETDINSLENELDGLLSK